MPFPPEPNHILRTLLQAVSALLWSREVVGGMIPRCGRREQGSGPLASLWTVELEARAGLPGRGGRCRAGALGLERN